GWQRIDQVKVDDGCYEAKGYDREGFRVEAKYDPKSFELVELERKRDRLPARTGATPPAAPAVPGSTDGSRGN
ncbi:MAG: PepSY domain-containing protein, partial [Geminicoccaceae bacterium]|nr:PepSY domain-containing protein [Geminicoccaceae bacterium]